jgi:hypothetical protein
MRLRNLNVCRMPALDCPGAERALRKVECVARAQHVQSDLIGRLITLRDLHETIRLMRSGGRVVEGARLESEYTPKAYRGFESLPLRHLLIHQCSPRVAETRELLRLLWPPQTMIVRCNPPAATLKRGERCGEIPKCGEA